jgi:hypothetical protein
LAAGAFPAGGDELLVAVADGEDRHFSVAPRARVPRSNSLAVALAWDDSGDRDPAGELTVVFDVALEVRPGVCAERDAAPNSGFRIFEEQDLRALIVGDGEVHGLELQHNHEKSPTKTKSIHPLEIMLRSVRSARRLCRA